MALGTSLFLIAVGAILRFAVTATTSGFNIQTVGVILMIVGGIGLLVSLFWMSVLADRRRRDYPPTDQRYYPGAGAPHRMVAARAGSWRTSPPARSTAATFSCTASAVTCSSKNRVASSLKPSRRRPSP